jgi:hypothetical protein
MDARLCSTQMSFTRCFSNCALTVIALAGSAACAANRPPEASAPSSSAPPSAPPGDARPVSARASGLSYAGGDGLTCETRVLILGAKDEQVGVGAEYDWLKAKYPGHKVQKQSLLSCAGKPTDQLDIRTADDKPVKIHFDISDFFGKGFVR